MCAARKRSRGRPWWQSPRLGGLLQVALGVYLLLALSGRGASWTAFLSAEAAPDILAGNNPGGPVGALFAFVLRAVCGLAWCWAVPLIVIAQGLRLLWSAEAPLGSLPARVVPLWLFTSAWLALPGWVLSAEAAPAWSGAAGFYLARGFRALFGRWGAAIFLSFLVVSTLALALRPWLGPVLDRLRPFFAWAGRAGAVLLRGLGWLVWQPLRGLRALAVFWRDTIGGLFARSAEPATARRREPRAAAQAEPAAESAAAAVAPTRRQLHLAEAAAVAATAGQGAAVETEANELLDEGGGDLAVSGRRGRGGGRVVTAERAAGNEVFPEARHGTDTDAVPLPSLDLLSDPAPDARPVSAEALHAAADLLEDTLRSFGVEGSVVDVRPGPVVTTYEYQPAAGIKVNAIVQRTDDLALAMRARSIRMEAPIPGKAAVGIEIPNPEAQTVTLKEVIEKAGDQLCKPLSVVLGRDVFGEPVVIDLAAQPHLLVAGATGSGKSVCVNAMISTMLLRCRPSQVRLLLIDPKMLELNVYNDIPHLLTPVVTDPKEALRSLKWMEAQMDHRYRRLARHSVRNIEAYNEKVAQGRITDAEGEAVVEPMPYYVCIVDELADLMVQLGPDIEQPITRLAQKARAVGIHLVLATQRPSVDVLTGVIKANIPCRIAFRVIQRNDSRTILDANGAERLLGRGDMLYLQPGRAQPMRVHGGFVDIEECEAISEHWRTHAGPADMIALPEESETTGPIEIESDPLFEQAKRIIVYAQHGSTSMLQRKMGVGYARAGRLMDLLEHAGVVGPFIGSKARDVLMQPDDLEPVYDEDEDAP